VRKLPAVAEKMKERIMKKLLAMFLVLGMASLANAAVLEVVTADIGQSGGRMGSGPDDKLLASDIIGISIVVAHNPYPVPAYSPTYDGYMVSSVDIDLHTVGAGSLSYNTTKAGVPIVGTDLDSLTVDAADGEGNLPRFQGISLAGVNGKDGAVVAGDLLFHCEGQGNVLLDLTLFGLSEYAPYQDAAGKAFYADFDPRNGTFTGMTEQDLGDLLIYQVPEPITMTLLGVGGLLLRRRR
jgi:hypothetical protein